MAHTHFDVLAQLSHLHFVSGRTLSQAVHLTPNAVSQAVRTLNELGLEVFSIPGRGYKLAAQFVKLDATKIAANLGELAQHFDIEVLDEIASTNTALLNHKATSKKIKVLIAETQTQGRGRRGRAWQASLGGSLTFSLRWQFDKPAGQLGGASLAVGLALVEALIEAGLHGAQLKWPNDIIVDGKKCAGILIETQGDVFEPASLVIGIGVNYRLHPEHKKTIDQPVTDYASNVAQAVPRDALLSGIFRHLYARISTFSQHGFAPLNAAWQQHHAFANQAVTASFSDGRKLDGVAVDIANDGALILQVGRGREVLYSGEVSLRRKD
jgi:BirA family transcriptional regulator, biotin operon repressor / biotin---[acetyl-CoA-carboxylase] ligase